MKARLVPGIAAVLLFAPQCFADAIVADGSWHEFRFGAAVSAVIACGGSCVATTNPVADVASAPPWTFSGPAILTVLDLFNRGDRFEAFDNSSSLGQSSVVVNDNGGSCNNNIGACLADPTLSRLVVAIPGTGAHSLTINVIQNAGGGSAGAAVFQLAPAAIPEPSTLGLLAGGIALLAIGRLRK